MSRAFLTAVAAALALGSMASPAGAQDTTSATGQVRSDTSGYTGAAGVDTAGRPGRISATDTIRLGVDSSRGAAGVLDTSGMPGRRPDDTTQAGQATSPSGVIRSDSGTGLPDTSSMSAPGAQPEPNAAPSGSTNPSSGTSPSTGAAGSTASPQ